MNRLAFIATCLLLLTLGLDLAAAGRSREDGSLRRAPAAGNLAARVPSRRMKSKRVRARRSSSKMKRKPVAFAELGAMSQDKENAAMKSKDGAKVGRHWWHCWWYWSWTWCHRWYNHCFWRWGWKRAHKWVSTPVWGWRRTYSWRGRWIWRAKWHWGKKKKCGWKSQWKWRWNHKAKAMKHRLFRWKHKKHCTWATKFARKTIWHWHNQPLRKCAWSWKYAKRKHHYKKCKLVTVTKIKKVYKWFKKKMTRKASKWKKVPSCQLVPTDKALYKKYCHIRHRQEMGDFFVQKCKKKTVLKYRNVCKKTLKKATKTVIKKVCRQVKGCFWKKKKKSKIVTKWKCPKNKNYHCRFDAKGVRPRKCHKSVVCKRYKTKYFWKPKRVQQTVNGLRKFFTLYFRRSKRKCVSRGKSSLKCAPVYSKMTKKQALCVKMRARFCKSKRVKVVKVTRKRQCGGQHCTPKPVKVKYNKVGHHCVYKKVPTKVNHDCKRVKVRKSFKFDQTICKYPAGTAKVNKCTLQHKLVSYQKPYIKRYQKRVPKSYKTKVRKCHKAFKIQFYKKKLRKCHIEIKRKKMYRSVKYPVKYRKCKNVKYKSYYWKHTSKRVFYRQRYLKRYRKCGYHRYRYRKRHRVYQRYRYWHNKRTITRRVRRYTAYNRWTHYHTCKRTYKNYRCHTHHYRCGWGRR